MPQSMPLRVHVLFPRDLWDRKMSLGRVLYAEALGALPGVHLRWGGLGWPGYDSRLSVRENLGDAEAVWSYKADGLIGLDEFPVRLVTFNEANHPKTLDEIHAARANLVVFHHENDMARWSGDWRAVHQLHGAAFFPEERNREIDCLCAGVNSPEIYPLRSRLLRLVQSGGLPGGVRRHPGYRMLSHAACRTQYADYVNDLSRSKILLTCSSVWKYPLAKMIEAAAAGCVVASDMPEDSLFRETLGPSLIEIDPAWPDAVIADRIRGELADVDGLRQRAEMARQAVRSRFTAVHYASRIRDEIQRSLSACGRN